MTDPKALWWLCATLKCLPRKHQSFPLFLSTEPSVLTPPGSTWDADISRTLSHKMFLAAAVAKCKAPTVMFRMREESERCLKGPQTHDSLCDPTRHTVGRVLLGEGLQVEPSKCVWGGFFKVQSGQQHKKVRPPSGNRLRRRNCGQLRRFSCRGF